MAKFAQKLTCCILIALAVAHSAQGRKLAQAVGKKSYSGDITAAASQTSANIQATVATGGKVSAATQAVKAAPLKPLGGSVEATGKTTVDNAKSGGDSASQSTKAAQISSYASGNKPATKAATGLSTVTKVAAQLPVGATARGAGVSTNLQSATSSGINNMVAAQVQVAAHNAMPGPNMPAPKP